MWSPLWPGLKYPLHFIKIGCLVPLEHSLTTISKVGETPFPNLRFERLKGQLEFNANKGIASHKVVTRKVVLSHVTPRQWHGLWLPSCQSSSSMSPFSNLLLTSSNEATVCVNTHNFIYDNYAINYLHQIISELN